MRKVAYPGYLLAIAAILLNAPSDGDCVDSSYVQDRVQDSSPLFVSEYEIASLKGFEDSFPTRQRVIGCLFLCRLAVFREADVCVSAKDCKISHRGYETQSGLVLFRSNEEL